jgi:hypothetical protein
VWCQGIGQGYAHTSSLSINQLHTIDAFIAFDNGRYEVRVPVFMDTSSFVDECNSMCICFFFFFLLFDLSHTGGLHGTVQG